MRSSHFGTLASSLLALLVVCGPSASAAAAPPKTGVVAGSVTNSGGVLTAGSNGAEYRLPSQAVLTLAPGAAVRVFPVPQQLALTPGAKTTTYSFALLDGRVDIAVPTKPKSAVLCSIGKLSAVIGSGQATVASRADTSIVASTEGDVRTLLDGRWQTFAPGTVGRFGPGRSGTPEPSIGPPALGVGQRLWFAADTSAAISGFTFTKVDGAERYDLRLASKDGTAQLRSLPATATRLSDSFAAVAPGLYTIATRSVDRDGIAGPWSAPEKVSVVGVTLPPGGYTSGGDIFIGKGQEVRFSQTEGLEMTYEGAGRYVPASEAVSLYRGETTVVSFRVPGSIYPTSARLRPRDVYAHVELGPTRAIWPQDPIEISIDLRTRGGAAAPEWLELKPQVMLGIEPLEVAFKREGNRLVGTVPPIAKPGPWVLRVEVKDQFGALLGRDFLEIAKAAAAPPAKLAATSSMVGK
jgi:hypothetical protein